METNVQFTEKDCDVIIEALQELPNKYVVEKLIDSLMISINSDMGDKADMQ